MRPARQRWILGVLASALLLPASCGGNGSGEDSTDDAIVVVTAFYPVQEAADRVGGGRAEVVNLTPPGAEPHDLELTPSDVETVQSADLILYLGGGFQPAVEDAISGAQGTAVDLLAALDTLPPPAEEAEEGLAVDPHVWLSPPLYAEIVKGVAEALSEADPASRAAFATNAEAFGAEIAALDDLFTSGLADCDRDLLVSNHAAFGYLAAAYGLTQEAISGVSPESEPTPDRLAELNELVQREGVTTIFTEELVSPEVAETLAAEAGVRTDVLRTIEGLTPEERDAGDGYTSLMLENLAALEEALGCS